MRFFVENYTKKVFSRTFYYPHLSQVIKVLLTPVTAAGARASLDLQKGVSEGDMGISRELSSRDGRSEIAAR